MPLTTQEKKHLPTHTTIFINDVSCMVLAEQLTCIRKVDVNKFIRQLTKEEMQEVGKCIKIQIEFYEKKTTKKSKKTIIYCENIALFKK